MRKFTAILAVLVIGMSFAESVPGEERLTPQVTESAISLGNEYVTYIIGKDGLNKSFVDRGTGNECLDKNLTSHFMSIDVGRGYIGASSVEYHNNTLFVTFGNTGIVARIHVRILPRYFTFDLVSLNNKSVSEVQLANMPLTVTKFMGKTLTNTRDDDFAGCILPLNIETTSQAKQNIIEEKLTEAPPGISVDVAKAVTRQTLSSNSLIAWCDRRVRLEGAKIAIIGCPSEILPDIIEQVEFENGLPNPTIGGVWAKKSKEAKESYLFVNFSEATLDEVIDYALRGGFGYIMIYSGDWADSYGSNTINRKNFPSGEEGLKKAVAKIHAAGLKAGLHTIDRVISKTDPLIHPVPHPGLLKRRENERILAKDLEAFEAFIPTATSPQGLLDKRGKHRHYSRDLQIDNEIITYDDIQTTSPYGFVGCARGAYGTIPARHAAGAKIENLAEFIGFFEPDVESDLYDIVVRNMAHVLDYYEFDSIGPDGIGENLAYYGKEPRWYIANLAVDKLYKYTKRDVRWEYNPPSNWSWHIFTLGNTTDFVTRGIIEHFDIVSIDGSRNHFADLMPYEFGWFGFFGKEIDRDATMPREIEYAFSKSCAFSCANSIETNMESLRKNGRTKEIFGIIKNWEELKFQKHFSASAITRLQEKGKEFTLDRDGQGNQAARQIVYGPEKYIRSIDGKDNAWTFGNSFDSQPLRVSIKSMPRLADYGDPENTVLIRPGELTFETSIQGPMGRGRNSEGTSFALTITDEQVKVGDKSFKITSTNNSDSPNGWGCGEIIMDHMHDMTKNRAVGTWVYGDGSGVPLHFVVEDAGRWAVRDWWVKLDFKGWKYVAIPEPAEGEVYSFHYPYSSYWPIRHINYGQMARVYIFLTNLAPGQSVTCYFTQLEALREKPSIIRNPKLSVGAQSITFPVMLQTEDYLEYDGSGKFRAFTSEGQTVAERDLTASSPTLQAGSNTVTFECEHTAPAEQAAKVEIITVGEPFK